MEVSEFELNLVRQHCRGRRTYKNPNEDYGDVMMMTVKMMVENAGPEHTKTLIQNLNEDEDDDDESEDDGGVQGALNIQKPRYKTRMKMTMMTMMIKTTRCARA